MAFLFVPINTIAYIGLPPGKSNNASALVNLMRNLGGSVGVSLATTMLDRRSQLHLERLTSHLTAYDTPYQLALRTSSRNFIRQGAAPAQAMSRAMGSIYQTAITQATLLSYLDVFKVMSVGALLMITVVFFLKTIKPGEKGEGGH